MISQHRRGGLIACAGVTMAALVLLTRGRFFQHLFLYNRNPMSLAALVSILKPNVLAMGSMAAAAVARREFVRRRPGGQL
jgi:hypothetical protein